MCVIGSTYLHILTFGLIPPVYVQSNIIQKHLFVLRRIFMFDLSTLSYFENFTIFCELKRCQVNKY